MQGHYIGIDLKAVIVTSEDITLVYRLKYTLQIKLNHVIICGKIRGVKTCITLQ